jgi:hypothetical protein
VPDTPVLTLDAQAAAVGHYRWIEHALYELVGGWVREMPIASVQVHLDAQSLRHAWHAELWAERLPVMAGADPDRLTVPSPAAAALFAALHGEPVPAAVGVTDPAEDTLARPGALPRLAGLYRVVLPRLVVTYERHLALTGEVSDAPVRRALRLALADGREEWQAGERLVEELVTRPHDVAAVHAFEQALEAAVVGAGPSVGLVSLPEPPTA